MTQQITISASTPHEFDEMLQSIAAATDGPSLRIVLQRIEHMSGTLEAQIQAATADIQADIAAVATDFAAIQAQIAALQAQLVPGASVSQADVDALAAVATAADAAKAAMDAVANPVPPVTTAP